MKKKKEYWKRIVFKTKIKNVYTPMLWHRCSTILDCPYPLEEDFKLLAKRVNAKIIWIRIELQTNLVKAEEKKQLKDEVGK